MKIADIRNNRMDNPEQSHWVVILGMHRSGTSLVANLLADSGFFVGSAGQLIRADRWNEKGYFEQRQVWELNEGILRGAGGSWYNPPAHELIQKQNVRDPLLRVIKTYHGEGRKIIKDPRLCLTLPLWVRYLQGRVQIVWMLRSMGAVAASLQKRDGMPLWKGRELWRTYNRQANRLTSGFDTLCLSYEEFLDDRQDIALHRLGQFLGIEEGLARIGRKIIESRLNHHGHQESQNLSPKNFQSLHEEAIDAMKAGDIDESLRLLEKLVTEEPDHALAHNDLGVLYYKKGNRAKALLHFRKAIELEPVNTGFSANLQRVLAA